MPRSGERLVLVTGGTGNQGGATVRQLLDAGTPGSRVLPLKPDPPNGRQGGARGVELARGDLTDPASLRTALDGVSAAFSVQQFMDKGGVAAEEQRGKAFADAVKAAGVPHLVYTSADGVERDSGLSHYESKRRIEQHIRDLGMTATILRPVAFMDNLAVGAFGRAMVLGMFRTAFGSGRKVQLVATADVGWFAARALEDPDKYGGREIAIAGDELSVSDMTAAFDQIFGHRPWVAPIPKFLPGLMMPKEIASMFEWMGRYGFQANIPALRREHPAMLTFTAWLKTQKRESTSNRS